MNNARKIHMVTACVLGLALGSSAQSPVIDGVLSPGEWDGHFLGTSVTTWGGGMSVDVYGYSDDTYLYAAYVADTSQPGWAEASSLGVSANLDYWTPSTTSWPDPGYTHISVYGDGFARTDGSDWDWPDGWGNTDPSVFTSRGIEYYVGEPCYGSPYPNTAEIKIPLSVLTYAGNDGLVGLSGQYWQYDFATAFYVSIPMPPPSEVWVDDDYYDGGANDGHTWGYDAFDNIQDGIDAVASGGTVHVAAGTYNETIYFASGFSTANLTISGDPNDRPVVTGGVNFQNSGDIDGLTFKNLYLKGDAGANRIINMGNPGGVYDLTMDNCVIDGENAAGRMAFYGANLGNSVTITNCEFKDIRSWSLLDLSASGATLPLAAVSFSGNYIHDSGGTVAIRGDAADRTDLVVISDNTWDNINEPGEHAWAAVEINHADVLNAYRNTINDVAENSWGEGEAMLIWDVGTVDIRNNTFTNNHIGIYVAGTDSNYPLPAGSMTDNHFSGNSTNIKTDGKLPGGTLDASGNWWGASDGASIAAGFVDLGSAAVDYTPWLAVGTDTSGDPGFQGDFSTLHVDDDSPQAGTQGRIEEAVALVTGSTINIADGTYTEAVTITDKAVTLVGESEAGVIVQADASGPVSGTNTFTVDAAGKNVTFQKLTIRHGDYGIRSSAGNVNVLHCTLYHNGWDGLGLPDPPTQSDMADLWAGPHTTNGGAMRIENSTGSEIAHCTVYENARAIRLQNGTNGSIHDNVVHDNLESGIYLASGNYCGGSSPQGCVNTTVHDNISHSNMNNGILSIGGKGNTIRNNFVYDNWNTGIMLWCPGEILVEQNTVRHNNLYSFSGTGNPGDAEGGIWIQGDNIYAGSSRRSASTWVTSHQTESR